MTAASELWQSDVIPFFEIKGGGVVKHTLTFEFGVVLFEVERFDEQFKGFSYFAREARAGFLVHQRPVADEDLFALISAFDDLFDIVSISDHGAGVGGDAFSCWDAGGLGELGAESDAGRG